MQYYLKKELESFSKLYTVFNFHCYRKNYDWNLEGSCNKCGNKYFHPLQTFVYKLGKYKIFSRLIDRMICDENKNFLYNLPKNYELFLNELFAETLPNLQITNAMMNLKHDKYYKAMLKFGVFMTYNFN
jgi:hypothetical protein